MEKNKTILCSAFPGAGKSYLFNRNKLSSNKIVMDSDSSTFDKSDFPRNYIEHIKANYGIADIIFISYHEEVRDALVAEGLPFTLVYPDKSLKDEYIARYIERGNNDKFVELLQANWEDWISQLENQKDCKHVVLQSGEYIADVEHKL